MRTYPPQRLTRHFSLLVFLWLCFQVVPAHAQDLNWNPTNNSFDPTNWFEGDNWGPTEGSIGPIPTAATRATVNTNFGGVGPATITKSGAVANQLLIGALPFSGVLPSGDGSGRVIVNGNTASLAVGQIAPRSAISLDVIQGSILVEKGGTLTSTGSGVGRVAGATVAAEVTVVGAGSSWIENTTLSVGAASVGRVTIADGALFQAAGTVTIGAQGRINIGTGGLAGTFVAPAITNDGVIAFDFTDTATLGAQVSGIGLLTKQGAGTLILTGDDTYTGGTTINAGTLQLGNGGVAGSVIGNVVNNGVLAFDRSDTLTYADVISGTGSVIQRGTGTTLLTGNNTYTGGTLINAGTLQLGQGGTTGSIIGNVVDHGVLAFDRSDLVTFAGVISGTGIVSQEGTGTTVLLGNNTYTGGTTISTGTLQLGNGGTNGSITGNVANNGVLAFNRSDSVTFNGSISGSGSVVDLGPGILILTGANTYTGGTTINGGTLQIGDGGTTGSIVGNVTDQSVLAFNRSDSIIFGGVISGEGRLLKTGAGTLTLPGINTYTGTTTIDNGSLIVDGSIASEQTFVNANGSLGGHGTIGGNVVNNGLVSQFNTPGTLTVLGDYTQNAGGTLRIGVGGLAPGQHDTLVVNGRLTLGGALQLVRLGGFTLQPGNQITFLTAKKGVSGNFDLVQNEFLTGTIVQGTIAALANALVLEGNQGSFAETPGVATTPNQVAVAKALDIVVGDPRAAGLIAFLNSEPLGNLPHDLDLIAPSQISSIGATGVQLGKVQMSNLVQRMTDIRAGSNGFSSSGFALSGGAGGFAGVPGPEGKSGPPVFAPTPENRWGVFVTGLGEFTNVDDTTNSAGYGIDTGGFTLGVDYRVTPNFTIGLTGGYAHTNVDLNKGGDIEVNGGKIGVYATIFKNGFYLDTAVSGGPSGYHTHRAALLGTANGDTDGADLNALVAGGYDWKIGNLTIGPTASFEYSYVGLEAFTETGSLAPLRISDQNFESERTALGAKASYDWKIGHITVIPQISAAWQHEFGSTAYAVVANFANGAGKSFSVNGPATGRDSLLVGAGATVILNERVSTYLFYDGEVARTNYESHNVTGGVRISF